MLFGAKITIASAWKKPSVSLWEVKNKISWIMSQEKIVAKLQDKVQLFESTWKPWARYIKVPLYPGHNPL